MTAAEFGEWFEIWRWQPWENIPAPPEEQKTIELGPMAFAATL